MDRVKGAFEGTGDSRTAVDVAGKTGKVGVAIVAGERGAFVEAEVEGDSGKMEAKVGMVVVRVGRYRVWG